MGVNKWSFGIPVMLALCACAQPRWINDRVPPQVAKQRFAIDQAECNANAWHAAGAITNRVYVPEHQDAYVRASSACMVERGWSFTGMQPPTVVAQGGTRRGPCHTQQEQSDTRCIVINGGDLESCWDRATGFALEAFCVHHNGTLVREAFFTNTNASSPPTLCESAGTFEGRGASAYVRFDGGTCDNGRTAAEVKMFCSMSGENLICQRTFNERTSAATYQRTNGVEDAAVVVPSAAAGESQTAVWIQRKLVSFAGGGVGESAHACEGFRSDFESWLLRFGARGSDIDVQEYACPPFPGVSATFWVLVPADKTKNNAAGAGVAADWQTLEFNCKDLGDLMQQGILTSFSTRDLDSSDCARGYNYRFRVQVLEPRRESMTSH
jgi:hypothetical protein